MSLEVDLIATGRIVFAPEEVIKANFEESRRRGVGGDVPSDRTVFPVGADHHRHGIPPDEALDVPFDFPLARKGDLFLQPINIPPIQTTLIITMVILIISEVELSIENWPRWKT